MTYEELVRQFQLAQAECAAARAVVDVLAERRRQVEVEGWTPEHDDKHDDGSLARAAACYARGSRHVDAGRVFADMWPWDNRWWKPSRDQRRNLIKASALLLAEIERYDRAALKGDSEEKTA